MTHVASPRAGASSIQIASPRNAAQRRQALQLLCARTPPTQRDVELQQLSSGPLQGLFVAIAGQHVAGAVLARRQPGRSALIWPPRLAAALEESTAGALLQAAVDFALAGGVRMLQALVVPGHDDDQRLLQATGFRRVAVLDYLSCPRAAFPDHPPPGVLRFVPCPVPTWPRLQRMVAATYQGTRDCPALNDVRSMTDVLRGYRASGSHAAYHWFVAQADALLAGVEANSAGLDAGVGWEVPAPAAARRSARTIDVGCLLLAAHDPATWELQYMGLAPEARRRGWGLHLVHYAQWLAARHGVQRLVLAVDSDNEPACRTYCRAGFAPWEQRLLWVRP
jgi:ribosomal protein S18 acetylase RimI-like enzyme